MDIEMKFMMKIMQSLFADAPCHALNLTSFISSFTSTVALRVTDEVLDKFYNSDV